MLEAISMILMVLMSMTIGWAFHMAWIDIKAMKNEGTETNDGGLTVIIDSETVDKILKTVKDTDKEDEAE